MPLIKNINEMNERLTFYEMRDSGPEPGGGEPVEVGSCWASLRTQFIKDVKAMNGTDYAETIEVVIRQLQSFEITNNMEIEWNDTMYNIIKINPDLLKKEFMVILMKESY